MIDFPKINQAALARFESLLHSWLPAGRRNGHEYKVGSLSGEPGDSLSINIRTGVWKDFASDEGGSDPVSLLAAIRNISQAEAARELGGDDTLNSPAPPPPKRRSEWEPIIPAPDSAPRPGPATMRDFHYGEPEHVWQYHTAEGELIGYIRRFKKTTPREDGTFGKEIKPLVWAQNTTTNEFAWRPLSFPKPRPLYRLPELVSSTGRVTLVEGEKCADALAALGATVTTWPGGGQAIRHVDWTPLAGRPVTIWPDKDRHTWKKENAPTPDLIGVEIPWEKQAGYLTAQSIAATLAGMGCNVLIITPPADVADGWDVADAIAEGWTVEQIGDLARAAVPFVVDAPAELAPWGDGPPDAEEPPAAVSAPVTVRDPGARNQPFRILGHDQGDFFYLSHASRQCVTLSATGHRKENLLQLAPLDWWERVFGGGEKLAGETWLMAANSLMQDAMETIFDPADIRGRGAWLDEGRVIYHAGNILHVDGAHTQIQAHKSVFVYEQGRKITLDDVPPADNVQAGQLLRLCSALNLRNPLDHKLLAGWLVCAPICGALDWRPHIWINGSSGTGKTWLIERIIRPILGNMALYVQSNTTEAGIRQTLRSDALPVMFDEAETENRADAERLQRVLILARQASRDSGGMIAKGTSGGAAMSFHIRSAFCFSSIGVAATQRADLSRITPLELFKRTGEDARNQWEDLLACWEQSAAKPEWCASIRARAIMCARVIAKNALTFATACTRHLGAQRDGDQIGALLAGAYALTSTEEITLEAAAAWCAKQDWTLFTSQEVDTDEHRCFSHLMGAIIQHEESGHSSRRSIGELVQQALSVGDLNRAAARITLERYGIGVRKEGVDVSNSHQELKRIFAETQFSGKWADQLQRMHGAEKKQGHFNKVQQRCVRLPLEVFEMDQRELI